MSSTLLHIMEQAPTGQMCGAELGQELYRQCPVGRSRVAMVLERFGGLKKFIASFPQLQDALQSPYLKTQLCQYYDNTGSCMWGDKCNFAHGQDDLRDPRNSPYIFRRPGLCASRTKPIAVGADDSVLKQEHAGWQCFSNPEHYPKLLGGDPAPEAPQVSVCS